MILHYFHFVITIIQDQIRDYLLTWSIRKMNSFINLIKSTNIWFYCREWIARSLHKGLPTIEATRHSHPVVAAKLLQETGVSEVLVGDALIEMRQAKQLIDFARIGISRYVLKKCLIRQ